jgi:NTP pyrophosphatase (non-canonical NTP hydrolase)
MFDHAAMSMTEARELPKMTFNEYQDWAKTTARNFQRPEIAGLVAALGLGGEAGEVVGQMVQQLADVCELSRETSNVTELLKKVYGHGHLLDRDKLVKELGDVLWYLADISSKNNITLDDIARENVRKLTGRYPDGFSVERSINREEEAA